MHMDLSPLDTSADVDALQHAFWRRLGGPARVELMLQMCDDARAIALEGIRMRHPHLTEEQARGALLRLIYGDELYEAAYVARGRIG